MVSPQVSTYFEVTGKLQQHSVGELLSEISAAGLSGSLRLEKESHKVIYYFNDGELVYAASNARQHRLFDMLMRHGQATKEQITACKEFTNDHLLANQLEEKGLFDKPALSHLFVQQLREIVLSSIEWNEGEWSFNALARVKEDVWQSINLAKLLLEYSKNLSTAEIAAKFNDKDEVFSIVKTDTADQSLGSQEYFVLSRLDQPSNIHDIGILTGFPEDEVAKMLYVLWMGGFVRRANREAAFSPEKIKGILSAEIKLKEKPKKTEVKAPLKAEVVPEQADAEKSEKELSLEEYLEQVEKAETYYDVLGVYQNAQIDEIKTRYFSFAKRFHPDKYHHESGGILRQRIQNAFTQISQSYDTLKDSEAREVYNFKMRRQLEKLQKRKELLEEIKSQAGAENAANEAEIERLEQAREEFDYGFNYLMNQDHPSSIPFFARAVSLAPKQARYHAYYGKALSYLEKNRHQAEQELVAAIKIEPQNTSYRIMLSEFYIDVKMPKRAEGELKKLLAKDPNNEEAKLLLDGLLNKDQ